MYKRRTRLQAILSCPHGPVVVVVVVLVVVVVFVFVVAIGGVLLSWDDATKSTSLLRS